MHHIEPGVVQGALRNKQSTSFWKPLDRNDVVDPSASMLYASSYAISRAYRPARLTPRCRAPHHVCFWQNSQCGAGLAGLRGGLRSNRRLPARRRARAISGRSGLGADQPASRAKRPARHWAGNAGASDGHRPRCGARRGRRPRRSGRRGGRGPTMQIPRTAVAVVRLWLHGRHQANKDPCA